MTLLLGSSLNMSGAVLEYIAIRDQEPSSPGRTTVRINSIMKIYPCNVGAQKLKQVGSTGYIRAAILHDKGHPQQVTMNVEHKI